MDKPSPSAAGRMQLAELWDRFAADPDWITAESKAITDQIHHELPQLGNDPEIRELTYRSTEAVIRLGLQLGHSTTEPDEADPPPAAIEYARELARRNVSVDTLLRAHQIGNRLWYERFAARAHATLHEPTQIAVVLEQAASWTHALLGGHSRGLVAHYTEERERWAHTAVAWRAEIIRSILDGTPVDASAEARLGYALSGHHIAFVLWRPAGNAAHLEHAAARFAAQIAPGRPLLHPLGGGTIAGWIGAPRPIPRNAGPRTDGELIAALGTDRSGVQGFARSHREALHARRVAELRDAPPGSVTEYRDVALEALAIADPQHADAFVAAELGPLRSNDESWQRLAQTLETYLAHNARVRPTAQALGIHENTVKNRIQAASAALGRPVESRPAELLVALRLAPLLRARNTRTHGSPTGNHQHNETD